MRFPSRPDIEPEVVPTRRLQPFVSKQGFDVPDRAAVEQERCGHRVPEHMCGHRLPEARQPGKPLEGRLHRIVSQAAWQVPACDEEGLFVVPSATEIAVKPFHRPIGEEEHPLLVSFPNDLDLSTLSVHIAPVKREDLGDACTGPEEHLHKHSEPQPS